MTFKMTVTIYEMPEGMPSTLTIQCAAKEGLWRQTSTIEMDGQSIRTVSVMDLEQGKMLSLVEIEEDKTAIVMDISQLSDDMKANSRNMITEMKRIIEGSDETLGEKEIDGRKTKGFRVTSRGQEMELWVDAKTGDPIQIEMKVPDFGAVVMSEIKFDVELDDSLFDVTPPEGYEIQAVKMDLGNVTDDDLLVLLRYVAEHNDNTFGAHPFMKLMTIISTEADANREKGLTEQQQIDTSLARSKMLTRMSFFITTVGESWHWQGGGVKFGDADTPICWYKLKDAENFRVVYGDLSVKDSAAEDLPPIKEPAETNE